MLRNLSANKFYADLVFLGNIFYPKTVMHIYKFTLKTPADHIFAGVFDEYNLKNGFEEIK